MAKFKKEKKSSGPGFDKFKKSGPKKFGSRDRGFGGGSRERGFGGGSRERGFGGPGRDFADQMFETYCDGCGKKTEVPFKPTGRKPVYCRDCFEQNNEFGSGGRDRDRSFGKPRRKAQNDFEPRGNDSHVTAQLAEVNEKLDKILKILKSKE